MKNKYISSAEVTPKKVLAGDSVEFTIRLKTGEEGISEGSRIILDLPAYLGYTRPSCFGQEAHGFVEVFCSNPDVEYQKRVYNIEKDEFGQKTQNPFALMAARFLVLDILTGDLEDGEELEIKWGYVRDNMGIGTKVTTLVLKRDFFNSIYLRYFRDGSQGLPDYGRDFKGFQRPAVDQEIELNFQVLPREAEKMRLIRRNDRSSLLVLDRFGNIADTDGVNDYIKEDIDVSKNDYGVFEISDPDLGLTSKELPLLESPSIKNVYKNMNIYFGDMHTHSSVSNDCIERERMEIEPEEMYKYGRDEACLDFMAITDHHQPWDIERNKIGRENWEKIKKAADKYNQVGIFAAFPGIEFRCVRGDTQIVFADEISYDEIDNNKIKDIHYLWEHFDGKNYISIPHFHNPGSLDEDEWFKCPDSNIEPVLEIYSCHGSFERQEVLERKPPETYDKQKRDDRTGQYFLNKGFHYGLAANSDGHKGNPGRNGLTAVFAEELTKDSILEAIRKRHCYGTTNARIKLLFTINDHLMGSILPNVEEKELYLNIEGENTLKAVDIIKNGELYRRFRPDGKGLEKSIKIKDTEPSYWYIRVVQIDNHMAYSSPIWFE